MAKKKKPVPDRFMRHNETGNIYIWNERKFAKSPYLSLIYGYFDEKGYFIETEFNREDAKRLIYSQTAFDRKLPTEMKTVVSEELSKKIDSFETFEALEAFAMKNAGITLNPKKSLDSLKKQVLLHFQRIPSVEEIVFPVDSSEVTDDAF